MSTHDDRFVVPLYSSAEAARHLDVPASTFRSWARGYRNQPPGRPPVVGEPIVTTVPADAGVGRAVLGKVDDSRPLRPGRFWCLPGDPDAGHPDAVPVPDEASLGAVLRHQVIAHATRFLAVYGRQVRFGRHTQWAEVTDRLDKALFLAGRSCGSAQAGAADARLVLADGKKPLTSASRIRQVTDDRGRVHWTRRAASDGVARGGLSSDNETVGGQPLAFACGQSGRLL
jgi:hypothetical protein